MPGGSGGALGLDLSAVIQAALVGLVLLAAALTAVRRAASRYCVVDAAYDDHLHPEYAMPPQEGNNQPRQLPQPVVAARQAPGTCAQCDGASSKICTGCKRTQYWKREDADVESTVMSLDSLQELTNGFSKELGRGSFGAVYEGEYPDGRKIAVKMLHAAYGIRAEKFQDEVKIMTKLRHQNIVRLVGYCHHTQQVPIMHEGKLVVANKISMALCLEHMPNGSLHELISGGRDKYDWQTCYGVITGICQGLNYLHNELKPPIFHLDLKPANVLLDDKMIPRIADFGISRILGEDEHTRVTKSVLGTLGYSPPEFMDHRIISNKFDIFSLGVVIIKMMAGPDGHSESTEMSSDEFTKLVQEYWTNVILEPGHQRKAHSEQVKACIEFGLRCVKKDRHERPTILDIVGILKETEANCTDAARKEWSSISKTMQLQDRPQENDLSYRRGQKVSISCK